jgi:hypothetical protein
MVKLVVALKRHWINGPTSRWLGFGTSLETIMPLQQLASSPSLSQSRLPLLLVSYSQARSSTGAELLWEEAPIPQRNKFSKSCDRELDDVGFQGMGGEGYGPYLPYLRTWLERSELMPGTAWVTWPKSGAHDRQYSAVHD